MLYMASGVDATMSRRYQLMETEHVTLLGHWIANWCDIIDFEGGSVIISDEAARANHI
jgi:hypothetical protein